MLHQKVQPKLFERNQHGFDDSRGSETCFTSSHRLFLTRADTSTAAATVEEHVLAVRYKAGLKHAHTTDHWSRTKAHSAHRVHRWTPSAATRAKHVVRIHTHDCAHSHTDTRRETCICTASHSL